MSFRIGDKVTLNPAVVTREFLHDCYFDASISKIIDAAEKGKVFTIREFKREHLRSSSSTYYDCAVLYDENKKHLGWLPFKALLTPITNILPLLTAGTIFKTRREQYYIVVNAEKAFEIHHIGGKESLRNWNKVTGKHCSRKDFDIVAVYDADSICGFKELATATPIWTETTPAREMTVAEIEKELGYGVKVVGEDGKEWEF